MAMFITFQRGSDLQLHVGEQIPDRVTSDLQNVLSVQVDNTELERVQKLFDGLRKVAFRRVVTYVGDDARFIVANWGSGRCDAN